jgi:hypothetical protein
LTALERRALHLASHRAGAEVVRARKSDDNRKAITTAIANRLVNRGLAAIVDGRLRVTAEGQRALKVPLPEDPDVYLRMGWGLTTLLRDAVREELILDVDTLDGFWKHEAARAKAEEENPRQHARKLSRAVRRLPAPVVTRRVDPWLLKDRPDEEKAA